MAPCCCSTSLLTTAMVCGVSIRSCVNFGDDTRSTFGVSSGSVASTEIFDRVLASSVVGAVPAPGRRRRPAPGSRPRRCANAESTRLLSRTRLLCPRALAIPFGSGWHCCRGSAETAILPSQQRPHRIANHSCLQPRMIAIRADTYIGVPPRRKTPPKRRRTGMCWRVLTARTD